MSSRANTGQRGHGKHVPQTPAPAFRAASVVPGATGILRHGTRRRRAFSRRWANPVSVPLVATGLHAEDRAQARQRFDGVRVGLALISPVESMAPA